MREEERGEEEERVGEETHGDGVAVVGFGGEV